MLHPVFEPRGRAVLQTVLVDNLGLLTRNARIEEASARVVLHTVERGHRDQAGLACTNTGDQQLVLLGRMVKILLVGEGLPIKIPLGPEVQVVTTTLQNLFIERRHMKAGYLVEFTHRGEGREG